MPPPLSPLRAALALSLAGLAACSRPMATGPGSPPDRTADGWEVASLADEHLAPSFFSQLEGDVAAGAVPVPDSVLVARHGRLVYERYWNGHARDELHDLRSATKSITALLVGIAIDQGVFPNAQMPLSNALTVDTTDPRKGRIALESLLEMRSGLACNDWEPSSPGQEDKMYTSPDWARFALNLPMTDEPGVTTAYCTAGVVLLGAALQAATHEAVPTFAQRTLFGPLGITTATWAPAPPNGTDTGGHVRMRTRDFARLGQLVLDKGQWQGQQIVSRAWIDTMTHGTHTLGDSQYGYLWWVNTFTVRGTPVETVFMRGNGGQMVFVFPALDLVAAFTGSHFNSTDGDSPLALVGKYVLPAALERARDP